MNELINKNQNSSDPSNQTTTPVLAPLVWIDMEMSGLDADSNVILEIATIVTDANLEIIAEGPELVIQHPIEILKGMDDWNREHHTKSGLWKAVLASKTTLADAEQQTLAFLKEHCPAQKSPLCGNSIWQDRRFIIRYMRDLDRFLHYRMVDVSTVKELGTRWYPKILDKKAKKRGNHRALDDIKESIEELKFYKEHLFVKI